MKFAIHPKLLILSIVLVIACISQAQTKREPEEKVITDLMERFIENTEAELDYTDLQEQLEYYMQNKLDLNRADRQALERLFFLSDNDVNAILSHRAKFGDFITIYELLTIDALNERIVYYLSYFTKVSTDLYADRTPFLQRIQKGKHEILGLHENDFQQRAGYQDSRREEGRSYYTGSPFRYVLRYRFNYSNNLSFGYTGEKDMGEQFFNGAQQGGFDFNSVHFMVRNVGKWKTIALGDYQVNFGQGLTFGSGLAARKSAYVLNVRRSFQPIRPYRSLNENEFLRGAAATYKLNNWELTAFGSRKYISTNFRTSDTIEQVDDEVFSSIQLTGLHRTQSEILNRQNVLQTIYGGHALYRKKLYEIGLTAVQTQYNVDFQPGDAPYQLYNFRGTSLANVGTHFSGQWGTASFFGEASASDNGAGAVLLGMNKSLHPSLDMVWVYRNYSPRYQTTFSNPFGENSDGRNEKGIYTGISYKLTKKWLVNVYFDLYQSDWLRYLNDAPSRGNDFLSELQYNPNKTTQFYIRFRSESKTRNQSGNTAPTDYVAVNTRNQHRLNANYKVTPNLSGKSRIECIVYNDELNKHQIGSLIFQDLFYVSNFKEFSIGGRVAVFSVDDYNARVYATEQDVLYQYAVPLYQNSGIRYYAVTHVRLNKKLDFWIKYSLTRYSNVNTISSGLEQIDGNTISDLRVQLRVTL
jgi:hypothetical protein